MHKTVVELFDNGEGYSPHVGVMFVKDGDPIEQVEVILENGRILCIQHFSSEADKSLPASDTAGILKWLEENTNLFDHNPLHHHQRFAKAIRSHLTSTRPIYDSVVINAPTSIIERLVASMDEIVGDDYEVDREVPRQLLVKEKGTLNETDKA